MLLCRKWKHIYMYDSNESSQKMWNYHEHLANTETTWKHATEPDWCFWRWDWTTPFKVKYLTSCLQQFMQFNTDPNFFFDLIHLLISTTCRLFGWFFDEISYLIAIKITETKSFFTRSPYSFRGHLFYSQNGHIRVPAHIRIVWQVSKQFTVVRDFLLNDLVTGHQIIASIFWHKNIQ